ncbi:hypothetical protein [Desulfoferula mesophila]|uniref:hypothetical protein n=1 Tax=Desulfoferula mesophila TaxID=3058419 RepID=UPI0030D60B47
MSPEEKLFWWPAADAFPPGVGAHSEFVQATIIRVEHAAGASRCLGRGAGAIYAKFLNSLEPADFYPIGEVVEAGTM